MVKALVAVPKNKRQRGHAAARNAIIMKQKLGMQALVKQSNENIGKTIPGFSQAQTFYIMHHALYISQC